MLNSSQRPRRNFCLIFRIFQIISMKAKCGAKSFSILKSHTYCQYGVNIFRTFFCQIWGQKARTEMWLNLWKILPSFSAKFFSTIAQEILWKYLLFIFKLGTWKEIVSNSSSPFHFCGLTCTRLCREVTQYINIVQNARCKSEHARIPFCINY